MKPNSRLQISDFKTKRRRMLASVVLGCALIAAPAHAAFGVPSSQRLEKAKDFIADEQWLRAIEVLRSAATDAKEKNKDEALFWLAHSLHQARDLGAAVETISQLERNFPSSPWIKPARSLRVEIAQKLRRDDVLWWTATPPRAVAPVVRTAPSRRAPDATAPPAPVAPVVPAQPATPSAIPPRGAGGSSRRPYPIPPPAAAGEAPLPFAPAAPPTPAVPPPMVWIPENWNPDTDLRIQALGSLIRTDSQRVIPMLKEIALDSGNPREASRAVFVLAQSGRPEAHSSVVEVAMQGSEPVRVAAVRELGRFGGPQVSEQLLDVYRAGNSRVKYQVVNSLGERQATRALMRIAESESNRPLRDTAIVTLGQAGGREQLQRLYLIGRTDLKRPIIAGLFNARAEDELIRIAEREKDGAIRGEILARLRLLGTPKSKAYLEKAKTSR